MSAAPVGNFYIYSFDGKLLQMYDVFGTLLKDYIYMGNRLIAEYDHVGARFLYYTPDQINSTRVVTDSVGTVVYSVTYDPYGGVQITDPYGAIDPLPKFSGKERDAESQLDYFGARYYDKSQYRFISADPMRGGIAPLGDMQLRNNYAYCRNNPITWLDITGKYGWDFHHDLIFVLALLEGMPFSDAEKLAAASGSVDIKLKTRSEIPFSGQSDRYHFEEAEDVDKRIEAACKSGDVIQFGIALHVVADSKYAHVEYLDKPFGHGETVLWRKENQPDNINSNPERARWAMKEMLFWIRLFISLHYTTVIGETPLPAPRRWDIVPPAVPI